MRSSELHESGSNQISRSRLLRDLDLTDLVDDDRARVREWRFRRKQWFEQSVDSSGAATLINAARPPGAQPVISLSYTESCASAAMSYRGMRDVLDLRRALRSWSGDASALTEQYKAAFDYEKECLAPILAPDYPDTIPAWLRARSPDRVLGVFEFRDRDSATDGPFCTGLLVGPSTVVTARHCFFKENGRRRDLFDALRRDEIGFRRAAPPYELLSLVPDPIAIADATLTREFSMVIAGRVSQIDGPLDIVAFKLASPLSDVPSLRFDAPGWNRRSVLFGPFAAVERGNPDIRDVPGSIKAIRWDRGAHCATANSASGCVRHTCQAFQTYSGAPLFGEPRANDPEGLVIIGMHIATDDSRPGCTDVESVRAFGTGNLAMDGKRIEQFVQALQPIN